MRGPGHSCHEQSSMATPDQSSLRWKKSVQSLCIDTMPFFGNCMNEILPFLAFPTFLVSYKCGHFWHIQSTCIFWQYMHMSTHVFLVHIKLCSLYAHITGHVLAMCTYITMTRYYESNHAISFPNSSF